MSVTLTSSGAGLFDRLGVIFGICANVNSLAGGTATTDVASGASLGTHCSTLETYCQMSPVCSDQIDGHWTALAGWRAAQSGIYSSMATIARNLIIRQVDLDASLPSKDITTALKELRRQMLSSGDSIKSATVSAGSATAVGTVTGTPGIVTSVKDKDGYNCQHLPAETLRVKITTDAQSGGATARRESATVSGQPAVTDASSYLWPGGSGTSKGITLIDAQANNTGGNLLYNGSFETFTTAHYADQWVIRTGSAGTDVQAAGSGYTLNNALKIVGDGSTLTTLYQPFNTATSTAAGGGGTPAKLKPNTVYCVGYWAKRSSGLAAGVLRLALVDGSNTVTNDVSGTANSTSITLSSALTTSYAFQSVTFRTPTTLPTSGLRLEVRVSTAITNTESITIDDIAMCEMSQLYTGGPYMAIFAGATNAILDDTWTVAISSTPGVMGKWMDRLLGMRALGVTMPFAGSPTLADALVS